MGQSLASVKLHLVWSTKHRYPFLADRMIRAEMHRIIGGLCKNMMCPPIIVRGTADHVHVLANLHRTVSIAELVKNIKAPSSEWVKSKGGMLTKFAWQNGYGAFSVDRGGVGPVIRYIANQEEHHRVPTFQEEFRRMMSENGIEFDERYVWD